MATNRDLLKEAIADAKAVKETAIANAKLALEEAFTPHLKSMLAAKLDEMDKQDEEVKEAKEEVEEADAPSWKRKNSPAGDSLDLAPRKVGTSTVQEETKEEVEEEINLDELLAELEDSKKGNKEEQKRAEGAIRDDRDHIKKLEKDLADDEKKLAKLKADEKQDVNEDARTDAEEEGYKDGLKDEKKDLEEDARTDAEEEGYLDGEKDEEEDIDDSVEDEEIDLEDMSEDNLKGFIEDVIKDMVVAGEIEPGDEFVEDEVEVEDVDDVEVEDEIDVDVEIDEAKKEELDERSRVKGEKGPGNEDGDKDDTKVEKETEKMRFKEELEDAIAQVNELKAELNEVNLLNAKLLYTNKIFKAKNLTESKKVKVLKAFDKAKDVRQAKTIFETLSEGLLDKSPVNESIKGLASKATGLEPKSAKQPIIESNDVYNRMRKLAGLI
jgi:flagellar motor protein MotB